MGPIATPTTGARRPRATPPAAAWRRRRAPSDRWRSAIRRRPPEVPRLNWATQVGPAECRPARLGRGRTATGAFSGDSAFTTLGWMMTGPVRPAPALNHGFTGGRG